MIFLDPLMAVVILLFKAYHKFQSSIKQNTQSIPMSGEYLNQFLFYEVSKQLPNTEPHIDKAIDIYLLVIILDAPKDCIFASF